MFARGWSAGMARSGAPTVAVCDVPAYLAIIMCLILNPTLEWIGSTVQAPAGTRTMAHSVSTWDSVSHQIGRPHRASRATNDQVGPGGRHPGVVPLRERLRSKTGNDSPAVDQLRPRGTAPPGSTLLFGASTRCDLSQVPRASTSLP